MITIETNYLSYMINFENFLNFHGIEYTSHEMGKYNITNQDFKLICLIKKDFQFYRMTKGNENVWYYTEVLNTRISDGSAIFK